MSYYVLRPEFAVSGSHYLHVPTERAKMPRGGKRYFMADNLAVRSVAQLKALREREVISLLSLTQGDDAGVFADMVVLPPNAPYASADPARGGGQVWLVLQGALLHSGQRFAAPASLVLTRSEAPVWTLVGDQGLQLLALQYPRRA